MKRSLDENSVTSMSTAPLIRPGISTELFAKIRTLCFPQVEAQRKQNKSLRTTLGITTMDRHRMRTWNTMNIFGDRFAEISPRVMIAIVSQYVIGCTCHNESMLTGLFKQRQFANERKWLFESADVRGGGHA